jgi:hypothetical protein
MCNVCAQIFISDIFTLRNERKHFRRNCQEFTFIGLHPHHHNNHHLQRLGYWRGQISQTTATKTIPWRYSSDEPWPAEQPPLAVFRLHQTVLG